MNPLQQRLAALRRRLRFVVSFRGSCWLLALLAGCVIGTGMVDWMSPLPGLVRAFLLVATLGAAGYVGYRYLFLPSCTKTDDLSLALRIERQYPELNDALASTVQFLELPGNVSSGDSPSLRREAVQQAMRQAQGCDFNRAIDARGLRRAGLVFLAGAALAAFLLLWHPVLAWTALVRLTDPFGEHDWPLQTQLLVDYDARTPAGQPFQIRGTLGGEIPALALIEFEGMPIPAQEYPVVSDESGQTGLFRARLDMSRQQGSFRFRVRANDAVSPKKPGAWHHVTVVQPPELTAFHVSLRYPSYTDLPAEEIQSGYDSMGMVLGTRVHIQGTTDRRVARAWVEMAPAAAAVSGLSFRSPLEPLAFAICFRTLGYKIPAKLGADGKSFQIDMVPGTSGAYDLHWHDEQGIGLKRSLQIAVRKDPAPEVTVDCLTLGAKASAVTPNATLSLRVIAKDDEYAVRSAFLEFRRKSKDGVFLDDDWQRIPLYDHRSAGEMAPRIALASLAGLPTSEAVRPFRLRPKLVDVTHRWSLKGLVEEGNVLVIRAGADDFDDVTPGKQAGLTAPLEIVIVPSEALKPLVEEAMREVRDELVRLNEAQKNALEMVRDAEQQLRATGRLRPEDIKQLMDARAEQKKIEERVGKDKQEGLQKEVDRVRRMLEDNALPRSPLNEKMDNVARALEGLTKDRLGKVQDQLEQARKAAEDAGDQPQKEKPKELTEARRSQEDIQKTLEGLLDDLDPFVNIQEMQGQARKIQQGQDKLLKETARIEERVEEKKYKPDKEKRELEEDVKKTVHRQERLAQRTKQLLDKMRELAQKRRDNAPGQKDEMADLLERAAKKGNDVESQMKDAAKELQADSDQLKDKRFEKAMKKQLAAKKTLDEVIGALEEKREDELDRLSKKQQDEQDRLDDIQKEMDELKKKVRDIKKNIQDPGQRGQALKKLAGKQKELQAKVDQMVRRLSRLRAEEAVREMRRLSRRMEEAAQKMEDGDDPEQKQQEALDRINDAVQKLEKANNRVENELAREKLAKKTDVIKRLKARQDEAIKESARIHNEMRAKAVWARELASSFVRLQNAQKGLAKETTSLQVNLEQAEVFSHILHKTAVAMKKAVARMGERLTKVNDERTGRKLTEEELDDEDQADREAQEFQKEASRRLQRLLDALKQDAGGPPPPAGEKPPKKPGEDQDGPPPPNQDGIPSLAEQKALRAEQQEVNERTADFDKRHPELENLSDKEKLQKLSEKDRLELGEIHEDQKTVHELARKLFTAAKKDKEEGDKP